MSEVALEDPGRAKPRQILSNIHTPPGEVLSEQWAHGPEDSAVLLAWSRFDRLTAARVAFKLVPCLYVQTDANRRILRIGKAGEGLEPRYRGGTGYALDAAMHGSGNLVFVAA